jgi:hypothetical protein
MVMAAAGRTIPLRVESTAEKIFATLRAQAYDRPASTSIDRGTAHWFEICAFGGVGAGCNMAIRRSVFSVWPGFHERTDRGTPVMGGGEHHAFLSIASLGYRIAYARDAVVLHPYPPTMDQLKANLARDLTASTAFFTLLLVEHPEHRRATLSYIATALLGRKRSWRPAPPAAVTPVIGRSRKILAMVQGPLRYVQGRFL